MQTEASYLDNVFFDWVKQFYYELKECEKKLNLTEQINKQIIDKKTSWLFYISIECKDKKKMNTSIKKIIENN
jgi:hypothetical protein